MNERMTTSKPDVQALIEHSIKLNTIAWRMAVALGEVPEGATKITADAGELLDRLLDRLSALSGETETEWGNEYILQPGEVHAVYDEKEARSYVERFPKWRRLVKRQVTRTGWEVVV